MGVFGLGKRIFIILSVFFAVFFGAMFAICVFFKKIKNKNKELFEEKECETKDEFCSLKQKDNKQDENKIVYEDSKIWNDVDFE